MKPSILSLLVLALLPVQTRAQQVFETNIVRTVNVQLTAYVQTSSNAATVMRIATKDVLNAMIQDAHSSVDFTARAKLLVSVPANGTNFIFTVLARMGTGGGTNDTDVTAFFTEDQVGELVFQPRGNSFSEYSIQRIGFSSGPLTFDVQGYTTSTAAFLKDRQGHLLGVSTQDANAVAGTGTVGGNPAVFVGKINVTAPKIELVLP